MLTQRKYKNNKKELSIGERLALLRKKIKEYGIDAFLVPHNDMYFNEITAPFHNRLEWITGFTGSAGFAIIFKNSAIIFTDGRYSIQIRQEVDQSFFTIENITKNSPFSWLQKNVKKNLTVGFDPWLHSITEIETQKKILQKSIRLKEVNNLMKVYDKDSKVVGLILSCTKTDSSYQCLLSMNKNYSGQDLDF